MRGGSIARNVRVTRSCMASRPPRKAPKLSPDPAMMRPKPRSEV